MLKAKITWREKSKKVVPRTQSNNYRKRLLPLGLWVRIHKFGAEVPRSQGPEEGCWLALILIAKEEGWECDRRNTEKPETICLQAGKTTQIISSAGNTGFITPRGCWHFLPRIGFYGQGHSWGNADRKLQQIGSSHLFLSPSLPLVFPVVKSSRSWRVKQVCGLHSRFWHSRAEHRSSWEIKTQLTCPVGKDDMKAAS